LVKETAHKEAQIVRNDQGLKPSASGIYSLEFAPEIISLPSRTQGDLPPWEYRKMMDQAENNVLIDSTADFIADQVVGPGLYFSGDDKQALLTVQKKFRKLKVEKRSKQASRDLFLYGLHLWRKISGPAQPLAGIRTVQLESIERVQRDEMGDWARMKQYGLYGGQWIEAGNLIKFVQPEEDRTGYGRGIMHSMMATRTVVYTARDQQGNLLGQSKTIRVPAMVDTQSMLDYETMTIFQSYAAPLRGWFAGDKDNPATKEMQDEIMRHVRNKEDFAVFNTKLGMIEGTVDARARFESFLSDMRDKMMLGTRAPVMKLLTQPGYTQASAREARRLFDRTILNQQRELLDSYEEELVIPILAGVGLVPKNTDFEDVDESVMVHPHFGVSDRPELKFADIDAFVINGTIDPNEARDLLREMGIGLLAKYDKILEDRAAQARAAGVVTGTKPSAYPPGVNRPFNPS